MRHKDNIGIEWKQKSFMECLVPVLLDRLKQIQDSSYLKMGKYPILTELDELEKKPKPINADLNKIFGKLRAQLDGKSL